MRATIERGATGGEGTGRIIREMQRTTVVTNGVKHVVTVESREARRK